MEIIKIFRKIISYISILLFIFTISATNVNALPKCPLTTDPPSPIVTDQPILDQLKFTFDISNIGQELDKYPLPGALELKYVKGICHISLKDISSSADRDFIKTQKTIGTTYLQHHNTPIELAPCNHLLQAQDDSRQVQLIYTFGNKQSAALCDIETYQIKRAESYCTIEARHAGLGDIDDNWEIDVSDVHLAAPQSRYSMWVDGKKHHPEAKGSYTYSLLPELRIAGTHTAVVHAISGLDDGPEICSTIFRIAPAGATPEPLPTGSPTPSPFPYCAISPCSTGSCSGKCYYCPKCPGYTSEQVEVVKPICERINEPFKSSCRTCQVNNDKIWTAIGCLPLDYGSLIRDYIFTFGIGIAGGISFLYFMYAIFLIMTSAGNAEKIGQAKQIIVSVISGLFLLIFSVFILRVIGVDIFRIPGFK